MLDLTIFQEQLGLWLPILTPIILGLTQAVKNAWKGLPAEFVPVVSCVLGVLTGLVLVGMSVTGGLVGLVVGMSAVGLWEVAKTTVSRGLIAGSRTKK